MAAGRPSILIPLPTATDDHQRKNAEALEAAGAAEVIEQRVTDRCAAGGTHTRAGRRQSRAVLRCRRRRASWRGPTRQTGSWTSLCDFPGAAHRDGRGGRAGQSQRFHFVGVGGIGMSGIASCW
jgi:hypothetical protein